MGHPVPTGTDFFFQDEVTKGLVVVDGPHYEIHEGDAWGFFKTFSLAAAASAYLSFYTATSVKPHVRMVGAAADSDKWTIEFKTGTSASATIRTTNKTKGTAVTTYCRNLDLATAAPCAVRSTATKLGGTWAAFDNHYIGGGTGVGGSKSGGGISADEEWVLNDAVSYEIKVKNGGAGAGICNLRFFYYE